MTLTRFHCYYSTEEDEETEDEHTRARIPWRCPKFLIDTLKYQGKLSGPYIESKYMKFRIKYPSGFIGRKALMVGKVIQLKIYVLFALYF